MHKIQKSHLGLHTAKEVANAILPACSMHVVDGGYLLHVFKWAANTSYVDVAHQYVRHVGRHFVRSVIIVLMDIAIVQTPRITNTSGELLSWLPLNSCKQCTLIILHTLLMIKIKAHSSPFWSLHYGRQDTQCTRLTTMRHPCLVISCCPCHCE